MEFSTTVSNKKKILSERRRICFWEKKKERLQIFLPHTALLEVDYQLGEAVGYLYTQDYESVIPKLEILLAMSVNIPQAYRLGLENVF